MSEKIEELELHLSIAMQLSDLNQAMVMTLLTRLVGKGVFTPEELTELVHDAAESAGVNARVEILKASDKAQDDNEETSH